jgi:site-specific DNA recombinase
VGRQVEDCERLVARKGWRVRKRYVDDDVSSYSGKPRPAYRRMLDDLRGGFLDAVVVLRFSTVVESRLGSPPVSAEPV